LANRFDELAEQLEQIEATKYYKPSDYLSGDFVDNEMLLKWTVRAKGLLVAAYGNDSDYCKSFDQAGKAYIGFTNYTIFKQHVGWAFSPPSHVSAARRHRLFGHGTGREDLASLWHRSLRLRATHIRQERRQLQRGPYACFGGLKPTLRNSTEVKLSK